MHSILLTVTFILRYNLTILFTQAEIPDLMEADIVHALMLSHVKSTLLFRSGSTAVFCIYLLSPPEHLTQVETVLFFGTIRVVTHMVYKLLSSWHNSITSCRTQVSTVITHAGSVVLHLIAVACLFVKISSNVVHSFKCCADKYMRTCCSETDHSDLSAQIQRAPFPHSASAEKIIDFWQ